MKLTVANWLRAATRWRARRALQLNGGPAVRHAFVHGTLPAPRTSGRLGRPAADRNPALTSLMRTERTQSSEEES
jgi:hypothetical protein